MSSIQNFPARLYFRVAQAGEILQMGLYGIQEKMQLKQARVMFYKGGAHGPTTRFRLVAFSDAGYSRPLFYSLWINVADIPDVGEHWLGYITFSFAGHWLNPKNKIYFGIETDNYTPTDTFALRFCLDWPFPRAVQNDPTDPGTLLELYGAMEYPR